jgi:hypothetical protein
MSPKRRHAEEPRLLGTTVVGEIFYGTTVVGEIFYGTIEASCWSRGLFCVRDP